MSEERAGEETGGTEDLDLDLEDLESEDIASEDEPQAEAEPEDRAAEPEQPQRRSRETSRIQTLSARARTAEEARIRLETELQLLRQQQNEQRQPDPAIEAQRRQQQADYLQTLAPHDAAAFIARQETERLRGQMVSEAQQVRDLLDRQAFDQFAARNPVAKSYEGRIEAGMRELRAQGYTPTRMGVLNQLVGQDFLAKSEKEVARQQQRGAKRVAAQTTQPSSGRSTAAAPRNERNRPLSEREFFDRYGDTPF